MSPSDHSKYSTNDKINFISECIDVDIGDTLTFQWHSDISDIIGSTQNLSNISHSPGEHKITLTVFDSSGIAVTNSINITITASEKADGYGLVYIGVSLGIVVIIMALLFLLFMKKRKTETRPATKDDTHSEDLSGMPVTPLVTFSNSIRGKIGGKSLIVGKWTTRIFGGFVIILGLIFIGRSL